MTSPIYEQNLSTPGKRIKFIRSSLNLSRPQIEQKYGFPEVTLKAYELDKIPLNEKNVQRFINVCKGEGLVVNEAWLLRGDGLEPISANAMSHLFSTPSSTELSHEDDEVCMIRDANEFKEKYSNAVVMMVSGDEMRPRFKPGDYVGGRMRFGEDIESAVGCDCIIQLKSQHTFFRRLIKNSLGNYNLTCINPNEDVPEPVLYNVEIEGAAPIIWHRWKDPQ